MNWVEKYRPAKYEDIIGQDEAIEKIKSFLQNFPSKKKGIIMHGGPGVGKTTVAHVAALEADTEIFELNASDLRNKSKLQEILKPVIEQRSLIGMGKIILIDEADGITGSDRGGVPEVVRLLESSPYPVILTANDVWKSKLSPLRKKCELIELKDINPSIIKNILMEVLGKEGKALDNKILNKVVINSKGDLRAALNDLQAASELENPEEIMFDQRNKETSIFEALQTVFKKKPTNETLRVFDSVNLSIDDILLWMEKNIPKEHKGKELARAYELLAKTDLFKGRIYKQQYWRFLVYENIFMSYGIASVKDEDRTGFTSYEKPSRILKIWLNNQKTFKKKSIARKYASATHISLKKAMSEFPVIKQVINSNSKISIELKLDEDELAYLSR